jgi:hypothetical protein
MPLITEKPRSNATMRIIIPNQIKRSIFSSLILYFLFKSIYIYGEGGKFCGLITNQTSFTPCPRVS